MENLIGQVFAGQYQIQKRLGRGGMGTVYLATQIKLKRDVAVKMLNTNISDNDIHRARFEREAETAASLNHLHIVSIFDYGIEGDIHYVAMPYISGGTLAQRYATVNQSINNIPALHETANVISQVASALDYAHSRGIIHRDVKPSNIMFDEQGNAFLTDFGIARLLESATSFTMSGAQIGTPQYMPPEQWNSKADLSQATDQYALAVMTFQLVTGKLPFDGDTVPELTRAHMFDAPHAVQDYRPDLPSEIDEVLQKALSKDSNNRYSSTGEFARAFDDSIQLADTETPPPFSKTLQEGDSASTSRPASRSHRSSRGSMPVQPAQTSTQPKRLRNAVMGIIGIIILFGGGFGLASALLGGDSPVELTATAIAALPIDIATYTPTLSRDLILATANQLVNDEATQTASAWTAILTDTPSNTPTLTYILPIDQTLTYEASSVIATDAPTNTPTDAPTSTPIPQINVRTTQRVNFRSGPGTSFRIMDTVASNQELIALAIDDSEDWIQIRTPDGSIGWVASLLIQFDSEDDRQTLLDQARELQELNRDALIALYNTTDGDNWDDNTNWLDGTPCTNNWYGVSCIEGWVTALYLDNNQLSGNIPNEIGNLTKLTALSFGYNQLSGNIPNEIGNLSNLTALYLDNNQLSGNIPNEIGNLSNLTALSFGYNQLSGNIPNEIGNLSNLTALYLDNNQLSGNIPNEIGNLSKLTALSFGYNQLSGNIPNEIGNLSNLTALYLDNNQLSGNIPNEIGNLSKLTALSFGYNQLSGNIPNEIGNLSNLTALYLDNNQLSGNIPNEIGNLSKLTALSFGYNQLSGNIPTEIGNLSNLTALYLDNNQLSGNIPSEIGNLSNLTALSFGYNQLGGNIPNEIGNLSNLTALYLDNNQLSGNIPNEIGNLSNLTALSFGYNQLSGNIPTEIGNLSNLTALYLDNNQLSGNIPSEIGNLSNLTALSFGYNQLSGNIPTEIGNLSNLTALYLDNNQLCEPSDPNVIAFVTQYDNDWQERQDCSGG